MTQNTTFLMALQTRRALPVLLAGLLQVMPMLRAVIPVWVQGPAPSAWAIVLRLAAGTVVALESMHAVSGASSGGVTVNSASAITFQLGQPYLGINAYEITTTPYVGQVFNTSPNPPAPGLQIAKSGNPPGSGGAGDIYGTPTVPGIYKITLYAYRDSNTNDGSATGSLTLTVVGNGTAPPAITTPPTNQIVAPGSTATLAVGATSALFYTWVFGGTPILNATNSTLKLSNVQPASDGVYTVIVSNRGGAATNSATLTVGSPPVIATQPQSQIALVGSNVTFSVSATGSGLGYQWLSNGTKLSQSTNSSLNLTNVATNQSGAYSVVITNSAAAVTSGVAQLLVVAPPSGTIAPNVSIIHSNSAWVTLSFPALAGYRYLLQSSATLQSPDWLTLTNLPPAFIASSPALDQPVSSSGSSFYRVEILPR